MIGVDLVARSSRWPPASRCRGSGLARPARATRSRRASTPRIRRAAFCRRPGVCCSTASRTARGSRGFGRGGRRRGLGPLRSAAREGDRIGRNTEQAIARLAAALRAFPVLGVQHQHSVSSERARASPFPGRHDRRYGLSPRRRIDASAVSAVPSDGALDGELGDPQYGSVTRTVACTVGQMRRRAVARLALCMDRVERR